MNYGPFIFLAAFFALSASWFGLILKPAFQLGYLQQTNTIGAGIVYPIARPGLAQQGAQVYRAQGCVACHSQQVGQDGFTCEVALLDAGTNHAPVIAEVRGLNPKLSDAEASALISQLPKAVLKTDSKEQADAAAKKLNSHGAKAQVLIDPTGADIARGWGRRRSVAEDYLYDNPVLPGSSRVGPDLANIGVRQPDVNWHLRHLYAPKHDVAGSPMPPYRYLFQTRKVVGKPSPEALVFNEGIVAAGYEVVPTAEARALAAYLVSLRSDAPLFSTPMPNLPAPAAATDTNAPSGTNAVSTNAPAQ